MNEYKINEAVKRAIQLRANKWLAGVGVGTDVAVRRVGVEHAASVIRLTPTQFVLSNGLRANRADGSIRGRDGWIADVRYAAIEHEERAKIVAAAELLDARITYSLAERDAGRNAEVKIGDEVVTDDYYKRIGVVAHIYNSGSAIVEFSSERGQGTYAMSDLCKLLDPATTDAENDTITYSSSDTVAAGFGINASSGAVTLVNSADFETKSSYSLNVLANDGTNTTSQALTVNVSNVNEKPAITAPATQNVNQAAATAITGISVADPDAGAANAIALTLSVPAGILTASNSGTLNVSPPRRRAPGAGRPRLAVQTKGVFARIPASLLPELIKRGGAARVLIDALSKKSS